MRSSHSTVLLLLLFLLAGFSAPPRVLAENQQELWPWRVVAERTGYDEGVFKFPARPGYVYRLEYSTTGLSTANGD